LPAIKRSRARGGAFALALVCLAATTSRAGSYDIVRLIEASYLYKFAHFVTWPAAGFPGPGAPLVICVQGDDPFGPMLDRLVAYRLVSGHPFTVKRLARLEAGSGCQIAYVGGGPAQTPVQALQAVDGAPVLTVTDEARGAPGQGIVNLVLSRGRVRFSIDAAQAGRNGVEISSKLLVLALAVKR
jgi:YfiR/HmsC-like